MLLARSLLVRSALVPALVFTLLALLSSRVTTALADRDFSGHPDPLSTHTRDTEDDDDRLDIGRLLFKQMRFRDLSMAAHDSVKASYPHFRRWLSERQWRAHPGARLTGSTKASRRAFNKVLKRENDKMIVDNLAALISNMKGRDTSSQLRMPSLRFG